MVTVDLPAVSLDDQVDRAADPGLTPIEDGSSSRISGFSLGAARVRLDWSTLEMRLEDSIDYEKCSAVVTGAHFPKASVVIPTWLGLGGENSNKQPQAANDADGSASGASGPARVLILISATRAADTTATSTLGISRLLARYVSVAHPDAGVHVIEIASGDECDLLHLSDNHTLM